MSLFLDSLTPGLLVTIDGPNGAGKTTLASAAAAALRATGQAVYTTRQPSPTTLGETIRQAAGQVSGRALACLVAGDRHHQVATEIIPKLAQGAIVICDRYIESSLVLQRLDGVETDFILAINAGIPRPQLRIRLLASAEALSVRLAQRDPGPARRLEQLGGPARELELYAAADALLTEHQQLPSVALDTTSTDAQGLGAVAAELILARR